MPVVMWRTLLALLAGILVGCLSFLDLWVVLLGLGTALLVSVCWGVSRTLGLKSWFHSAGVLAAALALYGIYAAPPALPQLQAYRVLQVVVFGWAILARYIRFEVAESALLILIVYTVGVMTSHALASGITTVDLRTTYYVVSCFLLVLAMSALRGNKPAIRTFLALGLFLFWIANVLVGVIEVAVAWHLPYSDPSAYSQTLRNVPLGFFFNQNDFAAMLALTAPFWLYLNGGGWKRVLKTLALLLSLALIVAAGSITGIASFLLAVALWVGFNRQHWKQAAMALLVGAVAVWLFSPYFSTNSPPVVQKVLARRGDSELLMDTMRITLYQQSLELIVEHPLGLSPSFVADELPSNPHSMWFELALYIGWPGLALFVVVYLVLIRRCMKVTRSSTDPGWLYLARCTMSSLVVAIGAVNGPSRVFSGFSILWVIIGLALVLPAHDPAQQRSAASESVGSHSLLPI